MSEERLGRVLDPAFVQGLEQLDNDELRRRRAEAEAEEEAVSYARRLVQGRLDILRAEVRRRHDGGEAGAGDVLSLLSGVLSDESGGPRDVLASRATRLRVPSDADRYEQQLDERLEGASLDDLGSASLETLEDYVARLTGFEEELSSTRRQLFARIDALRDELAARYKDGRAAVADLLADHP